MKDTAVRKNTLLNKHKAISYLRTDLLLLILLLNIINVLLFAIHQAPFVFTFIHQKKGTTRAPLLSRYYIDDGQFRTSANLCRMNWWIGWIGVILDSLINLAFPPPDFFVPNLVVSNSSPVRHTFFSVHSHHSERAKAIRSQPTASPV